MSKDPCHIRQQLCSDGTLRTWRWPMSLGEEYFGPRVAMTETKVKLTGERVEELLAKEFRVEVAHKEILRKSNICKETGLTLVGDQK